MEELSRSEISRLLDEILSQDHTGNTGAATQVEKLIAELYKNATREEWDEVSERYRKSFGIGNQLPNCNKEGNGESNPELPPVYVPGRNYNTQTGWAHNDSTGRRYGGATRGDFELLVPDGWFRDYLEWTRDHESPVQYHFGAAITTVASGIGRATRIEWEARNLYPNIYALLVGPTGARKGAAIDKALQLIVPAMGCSLLANEGTHQGFAEALRLRMDDTGGLSSDGLIVAPEFSVLMSKDNNKADLVKWLTDWYDSPNIWSRALRGEPGYELRNVCVSVLGGSNLEWLRTMPSDAITGGFMPRFILFHAHDKRFWRARPKFSKSLEQELQKKLASSVATLPECIGFDDEAGKYLDHWYEHDIREAYEASTDEQYQAWLARKQAAAMKLAAVWQIADGGPQDVIHKKWLEQARGVVDWGDASVNHIYGVLGVAQEAKVTDDVLYEIEKRGGRVSKRSLIKALKKTYLSSKITSALNTLKASGEIRDGSSVAEGNFVELRRQ